MLHEINQMIVVLVAGDESRRINTLSGPIGISDFVVLMIS